MPNKPPRDNRRNRAPRTIQSAALILQRVIGRQGIDICHQNQLIESIRSQLPGALCEHVVGVVEKADELVILADSAAWAARLRLVLVELPGLAAGRRTSVRLVPAGAIKR